MSDQLKPSSKKARILSIFLEGAELDRFTAESRGDHVLPQTVHSLERHGLAFQRRDKTVPGWGGSRVTVTAYRLDPCSHEAARQLLMNG